MLKNLNRVQHAQIAMQAIMVTPLVFQIRDAQANAMLASSAQQDQQRTALNQANVEKANSAQLELMQHNLVQLELISPT